KRTLLTLVFLAAGSGAAFASGANLSWNDCGQSGLATRVSACSNNASAGILVCSASPPSAMPKLNGQESTIDVQTTGSTLSPWWHMEYGGCRPAGLSCSMDFTANSSCSDPWSGQASAGANYSAGFGAPNRARLRGTGAVADAVSISTGTEWYVCK